MLSKRLPSIVGLVPKTAQFVADIGSDHGLVPLELLKQNKRVFASDNKIGPYEILNKCLSSYENIMVSLSSGFDALPNDVDTAILTGLGGHVILDILNKGYMHLSHLENLIISPHSNIEEVRRFLLKNGYRIDQEIFLKEEDIYYVIMLFKKGHQELNTLEYRFGPCILKEKNDDFIDFIYKKLENIQYLLNEKSLSKKRKEELNKDYLLYKEILNEI